MAKVSRRGFLAQTSAGAATIGALIAVPGFADVPGAVAASVPGLSRAELAGPVVVHVRNLNTGEIALMVGTREIVYRDSAFVKRLVRAARSATTRASSAGPSVH
jgi:hypothetical protein